MIHGAMRGRARILAGPFLVAMCAIPIFLVSAGPAWAGCKHARAKPYKQPDNAAARAVVCLVNARRTHHGLPRVGRNRDLGSAARRHSRYMQDHHCYSHTCAGEADLMQRVGRTGYFSGATSYGCGEVIGWFAGKSATPKHMVRAWMHEPAHRAVLLGRGYEHIGSGVVWGSPAKASANAGIYTADLCFRNG